MHFKSDWPWENGKSWVTKFLSIFHSLQCMVLCVNQILLWYKLCQPYWIWCPFNFCGCDIMVQILGYERILFVVYVMALKEKRHLYPYGVGPMRRHSLYTRRDLEYRGTEVAGLCCVSGQEDEQQGTEVTWQSGKWMYMENIKNSIHRTGKISSSAFLYLFYFRVF